MTNISDIYDSLHTNVASVLTSHVRLPDPFNLENNNEQFLRLGYGIATLSAENTNREICNKIWLRRAFQVKVTRQVVTREFDSSGKGTVEKNLLEDLKLVYNLFYKQDLQISGANNVRITGDDGIQFVYTEKINFITVSINIDVEYNETLT
jgi:hypothetical protein